MTAQDDAKEALADIALKEMPDFHDHYEFHGKWAQRNYQAIKAALQSAAQPAQGGDVLTAVKRLIEAVDRGIATDNMDIVVNAAADLTLNHGDQLQRALTGQSVDVEALKEANGDFSMAQDYWANGENFVPTSETCKIINNLLGRGSSYADRDD